MYFYVDQINYSEVSGYFDGSEQRYPIAYENNRFDPWRRLQ